MTARPGPAALSFDAGVGSTGLRRLRGPLTLIAWGASGRAADTRGTHMSRRSLAEGGYQIFTLGLQEWFWLIFAVGGRA